MSKVIKKRQEIKKYLVWVECPECGTSLAADGNVLTSYPPQYPYTCPKCGYQTVLDKFYPSEEYEYVGEPEEIYLEN